MTFLEKIYLKNLTRGEEAWLHFPWDTKDTLLNHNIKGRAGILQ